jgi:hypothetical protein
VGKRVLGWLLYWRRRKFFLNERIEVRKEGVRGVTVKRRNAKILIGLDGWQSFI